ncbi:hypothetical protein KXR64_22515 [Brucella intermedia]|uniref:hypothetical protein n=1 Tax=Brucella TaxID=234 RepID=UPI0009466619|nr:hypothetical protein [Brucella intermedia]
MNLLKSMGIFVAALFTFRTIFWFFLKDINGGFSPDATLMLFAWGLSAILAIWLWWKSRPIEQTLENSRSSFIPKVASSIVKTPHAQHSLVTLSEAEFYQSDSAPEILIIRSATILVVFVIMLVAFDAACPLILSTLVNFGLLSPQTGSIASWEFVFFYGTISTVLSFFTALFVGSLAKACAGKRCASQDC